MNSIVTDRDREILTDQLGRPPRALRGVEVRDEGGHPIVVSTYPLLEGRRGPEPFPTLFWLTCPTHHAAVSRLEAAGWVRRLEEELAKDATLRRNYEKDHRRYQAERWAVLDPEDRRRAETLGLAASLRTRGIGGLADVHRVKCLHLHLAHHLARGSTLGRRVAALLAAAPDSITAAASTTARPPNSA